MKPKKQYFFLKTLPNVANVIHKVKSMQRLTEEEELIYCIQVKGMSEEMAQRFIKNKINNRKEI